MTPFPDTVECAFTVLVVTFQFNAGPGPLGCYVAPSAGRACAVDWTGASTTASDTVDCGVPAATTTRARGGDWRFSATSDGDT